MNIFFSNSSEDITIPKVAISQDIPNIQDTTSSDYFHYVDFTIPLFFLNNTTNTLIDRKLLQCIYLYKCNSIMLNKQCTSPSSTKHMILKFTTLSYLLNFIDNIGIPIHVNSIRCIHDDLIQNDGADEISAPSSPIFSDSDGDSDSDSDGDSDRDSSESPPTTPPSGSTAPPTTPCDIGEIGDGIFNSDKMSNNNLPIFLGHKIPLSSTIDDTELNALLQKLVTRQSVEIDCIEHLVYFNNLYKKHNVFTEFKQSYASAKKYNNRIIKVSKPKLPPVVFDHYTLLSYLAYTPCPCDSDDGDEESDTDSELDTSELTDDNWDIDGLSKNCTTILTWLATSTAVKHYALSYDGEPILYFNNQEKATTYIKHISVMIIEKLNVVNSPYQFRLTKIENGYQIEKCIWDLFFPIYINYSKIILVPIFEI